MIIVSAAAPTYMPSSPLNHMTEPTKMGRIRGHVSFLLPLLLLVPVARAFFGRGLTPARASIPLGGGCNARQPSAMSPAYAMSANVMERPRSPETDSKENKKVFERLFVELSKSSSEVRSCVCLCDGSPWGPLVPARAFRTLCVPIRRSTVCPFFFFPFPLPFPLLPDSFPPATPPRFPLRLSTRPSLWQLEAEVGAGP